MNRRNTPLTDHEKKLRLLSVIGFIPGEKASLETKQVIKGLMLWRYGQSWKGRAILNVETRKIAQFIRFYAPERYLRGASGELFRELEMEMGWDARHNGSR